MAQQADRGSPILAAHLIGNPLQVEADAELQERRRPSVDNHLPGVRSERPGHDPEQGALPRPIVADHAEGLAPFHSKRDVVEGYHLFDLMPIARSLVIESLQDAMLVLDAQDRIVELNPAAARLIGVDPTDAIGQPATKILSGLWKR